MARPHLIFYECDPSKSLESMSWLLEDSFKNYAMHKESSKKELYHDYGHLQIIGYVDIV